jgi:hypothetical protein
MTKIRNFDNLVIALSTLKKEGYSYDFSLDKDCLACSDLGSSYTATQFNIDEVIHFEGADSSSDSRSTLYLISTDNNEKGTLIVADGIYSDEIKRDMLDKLKF